MQKRLKPKKKNITFSVLKVWACLLLLFSHTILFGQTKIERINSLLEEFMVAMPEQRVEMFNSNPYQDQIKETPNAVYLFGRVLIFDYLNQGNDKKVAEWFEIMKKAPSMIRDDMDSQIYELYQKRGEHQKVIDLMGPELENAFEVMKRHEDLDASQYHFYTPRISYYLTSKLALKAYQDVYNHLSMLYIYTGNKFLNSKFNYQFADALVALGKQDQALEVFGRFNAQKTEFSNELSERTQQLIRNTQDGERKFAAVVKESEKMQRDIYGNFLSKVKDLDKSNLNTKLANSKYILLDFWGSWCGPCAESHPKLIEIYNQFKNSGFEVIGIASEYDDDSIKREEVLRKEITRQNLPWLQTMHHAKDKSHPAMRFEVSVFPTKILIDSTGKVLLRTVGTSTVNDEKLTAVLNELMGDNQLRHQSKKLRELKVITERFNSADNLSSKLNAYHEGLKIDDGSVEEVQLKVESLTVDLVLNYIVSGDKDEARKLFGTLQDMEIISGCLADILVFPSLENFYISEAKTILNRFTSMDSGKGVRVKDLNSYANLFNILYDRLHHDSQYDLWKEHGTHIMHNLFLIDRHAQSGDFTFDFKETKSYQLAKFFTKEAKQKEAATVLGLYLNLDSNYTFLRNQILSDFSEIENLSTYFEEHKPKGSEINIAYLTKLMLKKDINNDILGFEAIRGKYVLLDFWGSWCAPCRASHPHLNEVYKKYKTLGLEIIGLATEGNGKIEILEANWKNAVNSDQIKWIQLLKDDREKSGFDPLSVFPINVYPTKILFDKDYNIIEIYEGASSDELDAKLKEIFGE